jgi:GT2 family glycosyltransferase/glycosyltransferase involved in cell wall biosynthesis
MDALPLTDVEALLFDPIFYRFTYPDVRDSSVDPLDHFTRWGRFEGRNPNPFFDALWYLTQNPDVQEAGINPLRHYVQFGARELRNPNPRFDAAFYVNQSPEALSNPLLYHVTVGRALSLPTERVFRMADCLPSGRVSPEPPPGLAVDVVIPVYRGLAETMRCFRSLLRDAAPGMGGLLHRIIVIDDASPEPRLSRYLDRLAARRMIHLLRNPTNLGFVASANRGMAEAGARDVVLLNSDTEVPAGWLGRLAGHAYSNPRVASVSPFSNNATICSYPAIEGGPLPFGESLARIDAACQAANAGRAVTVPTTVGFCMYVRRAALDAVGDFDAATFGRGYGEENDFCMRAAVAGWRHLLACDVFVYHKGSVSFGPGAPEFAVGFRALTDRWPDYERRVDVHVRLNEAAPFRMAATLQLFATNGLPTVLAVQNAHDGGIGQHVRMLAEQCLGAVNLLVLRATMEGGSVTLSAPGAHKHPELLIPSMVGRDLFADVLAVLRGVRIARVHVHHWVGLAIDPRALIRALDVPFDVTIHDWFAICPRINLLPVSDGPSCGEPGPEVCDRCIHAREDTDANDITGWRAENAWLLRLADRVFCATQDTIRRLDRYGLAARAVLAPLENVPAGFMRQTRPRTPLRVALLGVLAGHKGAAAVAAVAELMPPGRLAITLIGEAERPFPPDTMHCLRQTGAYAPERLPGLIASVDPDVLWFPATWPETWSYTLTAAMQSGRPIVASDIGAFRERLAGYRRCRLVPPDARPEVWVAALAATAAAPASQGLTAPALAAAFYPAQYLRPLSAPAIHGEAAIRDLRAPGRVAVVLVPERLDIGVLSPCAFIRMLLPLSHPAAGAGIEVTMATAAEVPNLRADLIVTHRYGVPDERSANLLRRHATNTGTPLVFDLDDNLVELPSDHPDAGRLTPKTAGVLALLRSADHVHVSTDHLAESLGSFRRGRPITVVENALDERLWSTAPAPDAEVGPGIVRMLYMGTATHGADLDLVLPALTRLHATFGARIAIDIVGIVGQRDLPPFITRVDVPHRAGLSYPAFVAWLTESQRRQPWAIGLAPLVDTPFNRCKSPIKMLDYAALGLATVASDMPAYRGGLSVPLTEAAGGGAGGYLAANGAQWFHALARLIREPARRVEMARAGRAALLDRHSLAAQAPERQNMWETIRMIETPRKPARKMKTVAMPT